MLSAIERAFEMAFEEYEDIRPQEMIDKEKDW